MVFAKGLRSKMEKMFSSSDSNREILNDPPPPYSLPPDFIDAGIKEDDLAILREYDTVIILDDSGSMTPLWAQACRILGILAEIASKYDKNGIDIHFLNNDKVGEHLKARHEVEHLFAGVSPAGPTPLGECLERVTHRLLKEISKGNPCKKVNYLVITDGRPTDDAEEAIVHIAKRLDEAGATLSQLGMQFIQIGSDERAKTFLGSLDNDLKEKYSIRDIVDTEPYNGAELTAPRLVKLLLGGINRKVDRSS